MTTLALTADTVQFYYDGLDFPTTLLLQDGIGNRVVRQRRSMAKPGVSELRERHPRSGASTAYSERVPQTFDQSHR